jgi:hypothetical protein
MPAGSGERHLRPHLVKQRRDRRRLPLARRGRIKVRLEWRLLMMTHNLRKVHSHQLEAVGA